MEDAGAPGGAPALRLHPALELFFAPDGDAYLLRGGSGREHVIRAPDDADQELLRRLASGAVAPDERAMDRLGPLLTAGAVVPEPALERLAAGDAERFDRQLPHLQDFGDPVDLQLRLRGATVVVLGCGGLGTWALGALASAGVGHFVLADDDRVERSNLNRQVLYGVSDIGARKVDVARAWLRSFDPTIAVDAVPERVRGPLALAELIAGADLLLVTADWPPYEIARWANAAARAQGVPFMLAGQQPPLVKVGPTFLPDEGACFACHETRLRAEFALYDALATQRRRHPPRATTLGPASALVGALLACEALHLLLGHRPLATHDRMLIIDLLTLEQRWETVTRDPECAVC